MKDEFDPILEEVLRLIVQVNTVSASFLQRKLSIGYSRAARILETLEEVGAVSTAEGSQPRTVLVTSIEDLLLKIKEDAYRNFNNTTDDIETKNTLFDYAILPDSSEFKKLAGLNNIENKTFEILCGLDNGKAIFKNIDILQNIILAGTSYSGKEKFLDQIIFSLLFEKSAVNTKFVFADYTNELALYNRLPQMLTDTISEIDKFISGLKWIHGEITRRQRVLAESGTRSFVDYNLAHEDVLPKIVVIIRNIEYFAGKREEKEYLRDVIALGNKYGFNFILVTDMLSSVNIPTYIQSNIPTYIFFKAGHANDVKLPGIIEADKLKVGEEFILKTFDEVIKGTVLSVSEEEIKRLHSFLVKN